MKTAFFEVKENWEKEEIKKYFPKAIIFEEKIQEVEISKINSFDVISVFIYSKVDEKLLKQLKKVKLIATRSTGFDHIATNYCQKKDITVCTVPHYGENTVAEFTFGLLLAISRKIIDSVNRVKTGSFDFSGLRGFDLAGKTVGVIGFGNIGQKFAKMCKGFEMEVLVYDAFADKLEEKAREMGVQLVSLDKLYKTSDIISLHIPSLPQTKHIICETSIKKMKEGVIILNTSRGDLIDSKALMQGIFSKKVGFAGLDVLEGESLLKIEENFLTKNNKSLEDVELMLEDHILISNPRVYITPHNAFNTIDALSRILHTTFENISEFEKGNKINTLIRR